MAVNSEDPKLRAFKMKRDAWHHRCDGLKAAGRASDPNEYDKCNAELEELAAEGRREGWVK